MTNSLISSKLRMNNVYEAMEFFFKENWTDGLPVVPPTEDAVREMLETVDRDPQEVIGFVAPKAGKATVEKIAINAVMAGCRPEYLPVVIAAVEAAADPQFNLARVQGTTNPASPLIIVNGPITKEFKINSGPNVFGQGWRANATIGRALRLIMMNIGGALPGIQDKATFGHPGKFTYCIAENEDANPWEPLQVERGYPRDANTVTVYAGEAPHSISDHMNKTARGVLTTIADTITTTGNNNMYFMGEMLVVIGPEHAAIIAGEGWTKQEVRHFLFENARKPLGQVKRCGNYIREAWDAWPKWIDQSDDRAMVPIVRELSDFIIVVAGGAGSFSVGIPGYGGTSIRAITKPIRLKGGPLIQPNFQVECKVCKI